MSLGADPTPPYRDSLRVRRMEGERNDFVTPRALLERLERRTPERDDHTRRDASQKARSRPGRWLDGA